MILTTVCSILSHRQGVIFCLGHELGHHELRHVSRRFSLVVILGLLTNIAGQRQLDRFEFRC